MYLSIPPKRFRDKIVSLDVDNILYIEDRYGYGTYSIRIEQDDIRRYKNDITKIAAHYMRKTFKGRN